MLLDSFERQRGECLLRIKDNKNSVESFCVPATHCCCFWHLFRGASAWGGGGRTKCGTRVDELSTQLVTAAVK